MYLSSLDLDRTGALINTASELQRQSGIYIAALIRRRQELGDRIQHGPLLPPLPTTESPKC